MVLGPSVDGLRVVRSGVKPGEKIVINGLQRVQPGALVTAQMVAMEQDSKAPQAKADVAETKKEVKVADASAKTKE